MRKYKDVSLLVGVSEGSQLPPYMVLNCKRVHWKKLSSVSLSDS